jgi:hypothetical protein
MADSAAPFRKRLSRPSRVGSLSSFRCARTASRRSLGNLLRGQIGYPDRRKELSLSLRTGRGRSLYGLGSLPVLCFESVPFSRTFYFEGG